MSLEIDLEFSTEQGLWTTVTCPQFKKTDADMRYYWACHLHLRTHRTDSTRATKSSRISPLGSACSSIYVRQNWVSAFLGYNSPPGLRSLRGWPISNDQWLTVLLKESESCLLTHDLYHAIHYLATPSQTKDWCLNQRQAFIRGLGAKLSKRASTKVFS